VKQSPHLRIPHQNNIAAFAAIATIRAAVGQVFFAPEMH
jgi:hypothetical protein